MRYKFTRVTGANFQHEGGGNVATATFPGSPFRDGISFLNRGSSRIWVSTDVDPVANGVTLRPASASIADVAPLAFPGSTDNWYVAVERWDTSNVDVLVVETFLEPKSP